MAALVVRFVLAGDASFTYNEATYVELAAHPWWSAYYPDTVFVRHPPVAFLLLSVWTGLFGADEAVVRFLALLATAAGVWAVWDAVRRMAGPVAALFAGVILAAAFPLHAYSLQATMYPFAFAFAAFAVWARAAGRTMLEGWMYAGLALTHLFGFLFLALWAFGRRHELGRVLAVVALPALWLVAAAVVALIVNTEGDVMRLGPIGQAVRGARTAEKAVAVAPLVHLAAGLMAWWTLNPVLAGVAWGLRGRFVAWTVAVVFLGAYFFIAAPFPRYALIPLPMVVLVGLVALMDRPLVCRGRKRAFQAVAVVVVALSSLPLGFVYLEHGPDPRAAGDVPGVQEWQAAVALVPDEAGIIATSGPTATAYYLGQAGWQVVDRSEAPYRIVLERDDVLREVVRLDAPSDLDGPDAVAAEAWVVPDHWSGVADDVVRTGLRTCGEAKGLIVYAGAC
ncbi:MAG: glycosyltransferase family 39 protein [Euryarchaeota archaeon]|nr:glycosyltransferase family 39 protein [Euryarchaeota archaeon]